MTVRLSFSSIHVKLVRKLCLSIIFLSVTLVSCTGYRPKPPVIPEDIENRIHTVALIGARFQPEFVIELPSAGSKEGAADGAKHGAAIGAAPGFELAGPVFGLPFAAAGALIGAIIGGIYGASTAETEELVESAKAYVEKRIEEFSAQERLLYQVLTKAQQETNYRFKVMSDLGAEQPAQLVSYKDLKDPELDLVIETRVISLGIREEHFGTNPKLATFIRAHIKLTLLPDKVELYSRLQEYETEYFDYQHWSDLEGQPIKDSLEYGIIALAEEIVRELFNRD